MSAKKKRQHEETDRILELEEELTRVRAELDRFVSVASHDLQAPLNKIQGFADLLRRIEGDNLTEKGSRYIDIMVEATQEMQELIQGLLLYSRVGSRAEPFAPVDLNDVLAQARTKLGELIEASGAKVEVERLPTIDADAAQMVQLFEQLLRNAIIYVEKGESPQVRVSCQSEDAGLVRLVVEDQGIGIEAQYADKIFEIFERLHAKSEYPGVGIGLAVSRKIVERHRGTIQLIKSGNLGASFEVALPVSH